METAIIKRRNSVRTANEFIRARSGSIKGGIFGWPMASIDTIIRDSDAQGNPIYRADKITVMELPKGHEKYGSRLLRHRHRYTRWSGRG